MFKTIATVSLAAFLATIAALSSGCADPNPKVLIIQNGAGEVNAYKYGIVAQAPSPAAAPAPADDGLARCERPVRCDCACMEPRGSRSLCAADVYPAFCGARYCDEASEPETAPAPAPAVTNNVTVNCGKEDSKSPLQPRKPAPQPHTCPEVVQ